MASLSLGCQCSNTQVQVDPPPTNVNDLVLGFTKQGLCPCSKTQLRRKRGVSPLSWWEETGNKCPHCPSGLDPVGLLRFTNMNIGKEVLKLTSSQTSALRMRWICSWARENHFRRKTNKILLLQDKAAAALATAESNLAKERKISDDLKAILARDITHYKERLVAAGRTEGLLLGRVRAAEANYEQSEAKLAEERQKNRDLEGKLAAVEIAAESERAALAEFVRIRRKKYGIFSRFRFVMGEGMVLSSSRAKTLELVDLIKKDNKILLDKLAAATTLMKRWEKKYQNTWSGWLYGSGGRADPDLIVDFIGGTWSR